MQFISTPKLSTIHVIRRGKDAWVDNFEPGKKNKAVDNDKKNLDELIESIPGLQNVVDPKKNFILKFLWLLIVLGSTVVCFYQVYNNFQLFLSTPISSHITIQRNLSLKFPSLTICSFINSYPKLHSYIKILAKKKGKNPCRVFFLEVLDDLNLTTIFRLTGPDCLVKNFGIFSKSGQFNINLTSVVESKELLLLYGTCKTYSIPSLIQMNYKFKLGFNHSMPKCDLGQVLFVIHNDDEDIVYKISTRYLATAPNTTISFGLSAKRFQFLNRPEFPCNSASFVDECERKCIEDVLKQKISCRFPFMQFEDHDLCTNFSEAEFEWKKVILLATSFKYSENCLCPNKCEELMYTKNLKKSEPGKDILEMFFEDNFVDNIEEYYSYDFILFLCDVGGNLGLFLGLCIPAIIDVLQHLIFYVVKDLI